MKADYTEVFTNDHLNFELAYINKHLGDMEFILENREAAAEYYKKARIQEYNKDAIKGSEFYNSPYLLPYFEADLAYREELIKRNSSFWGLKYHKRVLSPKLYYERLAKSYENYTEAYRTAKELVDEWNSKNDQDRKIILQKLDNLKDAGVASINEFYAKDLIKSYETSNDALKAVNSANMDDIQKLAIDTEKQYNDLKTVESNFSKSFQRYATSAVLSQFAPADKQLISSGLDFAKTGKVDLLQLIASNANEYDGFYGDIQDAVTVYNRVQNNLESLKNIDIDGLLKKPSLEKLVSESDKVLDVMSQYDQTRGFAKDVKDDLLFWQDNYTALKSSLDELKDIGIKQLTNGQKKFDALKNCLQRPTCACVQEITSKPWFKKLVKKNDYLKAQFKNLPKLDCQNIDRIENEVKALKTKFDLIVTTDEFNYNDAIALGDLFANYADDVDKEKWQNVKDTLQYFKQYMSKDSLNYRFQLMGEELLKNNPKLNAIAERLRLNIKNGKINVTNLILEEVKRGTPESYTYLRLLYKKLSNKEINLFDVIGFETAISHIIEVPDDKLSRDLFALICKEFHKELLPLMDEKIRTVFRQFIRL